VTYWSTETCTPWKVTRYFVEAQNGEWQIVEIHIGEIQIVKIQIVKIQIAEIQIVYLKK
jgi:hypothetical protein